MELRIYRVIIEFVRRVRPLLERVHAKDDHLSDQLRRALSSVPLNVQEGSYSQGRNVKARFHNALGSAAEVRACLDVAEALGYIERVDDDVRDSLDHIIATLHRLTQR